MLDIQLPFPSYLKKIYTASIEFGGWKNLYHIKKKPRNSIVKNMKKNDKKEDYVIFVFVMSAKFHYI